MLESIKDAYEEENMQTQSSVLDYKIDLYFHEHQIFVDQFCLLFIKFAHKMVQNFWTWPISGYDKNLPSYYNI